MLTTTSIATGDEVEASPSTKAEPSSGTDSRCPYCSSGSLAGQSGTSRLGAAARDEPAVRAFNPPHLVPLVEVVPGARTDPAVGARAVAFYQAIAPKRLELKQQLWAAIEAAARPDALLASSSSALPATAIAERMRQPHRLAKQRGREAVGDEAAN